MKIVDTRVYTGRNIYSHKLCIKLTVDVEDKYDTPTMDIEGFNERLLKALPNLKTHKCALGYVGGFVERLNTGTYLPHVFEHMIIEMQNALGFKDVKYGKARCVDNSIYNVIYQYEVKEAGILCAKYALECINTIMGGNDYPMDEVMVSIEKSIADIRLGPSTLGIYSEALKRGIPVLKIGSQSILQLGYGKRQRRIEATLTDTTPCIAVDIACDKELTREALKTAGIPVAEGEAIDNAEDVVGVCQKIGYPVVVKPLDGNQGKGVTVGIMNDSAALWAYDVASKINNNVLIEKFIEGQDYRVLVLNKKVVAVSLRMPPRIVGDGEHNILQLIDKENENPLRGFDHEKPLTKISIDDITINYLKNNGVGLDYIPQSGEKVTLRFNANLSTGGVAKDCTDIIHPDNIEIFIRAAEAVGLDIAGIDICTKDISKPLRETGGVIIEVNAAPGIRMHMYPTYGKPRNAAAYIVDYLFPSEESYSIPVVSVTGTNGKTTTTRMIAHTLALKGLCVGMTTTSGVYINNKLISKGDNTGPDSARCVLMDKSVEAAVLETARGGIIRRGLGYDLADVGVITNISGDHLGIDGIETMEDLVNVKSLVAEAVKDYGCVVLNADDPTVNIINQRVKSNIIYFSKNPDNIILKKHLQDQGFAVFLKDNFICFGDGEKVQPIVNISDIPSTMDGKLEYNIENAMAAAAGCIGLKEDIETIAKGLKTFFLDEIQNPGRFNVYSVDNFKVVVDYGHNIGGYNAVISGLKRLDAKRLIGVIAVPGDRKDENIVELGRISGSEFDYVYIKEDKDKRGRKEGETAAILEMGVLSSGMNSSSYRVILDEGDALQAAMENARDGDCIVVFYEDYDYIINTITNFKNCQKIQDEKANVV